MAVAAWYMRDLHRALWTVLMWGGLLLFINLSLLRDTFDNPSARLAESKTAVADLAPESIPDARNAAVLYRQAQAAKVAFSGSRSGWYTEIGSPEFVPSKEFQAFLKDNGNAAADLMAASKMKECVWGLTYSGGMGMAIPHLSDMRRSARLLALRARVCAQDGDHQAAAKALAAIYRMAQHMETDPLLMCGLVSVAMSQIATSMLESIVLWETPSTVADLQAYREALWLDQRPRERLARLLEGEKILGVYSLDLYVQRGITTSGGDVNIPWYGAERKSFLAAMDALVEGARSGRLYKQQDDQDIHELIRSVQCGPAIMSGLMVPANASAAASFLKSHDRTVAADVGLAILQFRLKHGHDPKGLDGLVTKFLQAVPRDGFNSQPLQMRSDSSGFVERGEGKTARLKGLIRVYGFGQNGLDDEGHNTWSGEVVPNHLGSGTDDPAFRVPPIQRASKRKLKP